MQLSILGAYICAPPAPAAPAPAGITAAEIRAIVKEEIASIRKAAVESVRPAQFGTLRLKFGIMKWRLKVKRMPQSPSGQSGMSSFPSICSYVCDQNKLNNGSAGIWATVW
eukprot:CAMPEP_0170078516 /NCGR_PEP_ID=MMETSP0019_2-20121128/15086_1 /TAXON_ID=98059 /ORGANISM="Dinobryon sp., Strain UTEXLB2267" /LENGTH=110 /DNA_ID=CAMNT_0010291429 /DNA_START=125 /DNA_END=454 /DNA_ORIENTATION=+